MSSVITMTDSSSSAADRNRKQRALVVVAKAQRTFDAARAALTVALEACIDAPTDDAFNRARTAQVELDEAEGALADAQHDACRVEYEILTKERAAEARDETNEERTGQS